MQGVGAWVHGLVCEVDVQALEAYGGLFGLLDDVDKGGCVELRLEVESGVI